MRAGQREYRIRVIEIYPEVSFTEMAALSGLPLTSCKRTWTGTHQRTDLLGSQGITLPTVLYEPGDSKAFDPGSLAGVDDVLDTAAAAWTARRAAQNMARSLPDPPECFSDGLPCAIWV